MQNLLSDLTALLVKDQRLVADGGLLKNKIVELALGMDAELIRLLLSDAEIKENFFIEVAGTLVFDKAKFQRFISNKEFLPDSYTAFKNKIGLVDERGDYLIDSRNVVLGWPYKDCVLEGGQTKEDQKRDEIFWNTTLAPDEIDRLLAPKVFTGWKRYDQKGEHLLDGKKKIDFRNENLVIRGNNLLALHALKPLFRERIKVIYIDPPYKTGSDSFRYNDSFRHSTWLTFMKNRLEIAKELLRNDGCIFVQLDDREVSYLRVALDEIFGTSNYVNQIVFSTNSPFGYKKTSGQLFKQAGYILLYAKNKTSLGLKNMYVESSYDRAYRFVFDDVSIPESKWQWRDIGDVVAEKMKYDNKQVAARDLGKDRFHAEIAQFAIKHADRVFRTASVTGGALAKRSETIQRSKKLKSSVVRHPQDDMDYMFIGGERVIFYKERLVEADGRQLPGTIITDIWDDLPIEGIAKEGGVEFKRGKKPESLLSRIIEMTTQEGDIVADFCLGSGTTAAVAHKMKRQYIGVEQLDYEGNDSLVRLPNVIAGDQTGISKSIKWKGGGEFLYCELMGKNAVFVEKIQKAKKTDALMDIWADMQAKAFISYKVDPKAIDAERALFQELSLADQKKFLLEILDKNHLYVNYDEINDAEYKVSEADKKLNRMFYGEV